MDLVIGAITRKLSDIFMISKAEIDPPLPTAEYVVDSLVAVELRNRAFRKSGGRNEYL